jgi:hypothetical protein
MDDEAFRAQLGKDGLLRPDAALTPPDPSQAYVVFAQRPDARLEIAQLRQHAERFFGTTLGLTVPKMYGGEWPETDAATVVLGPSTVPGGVRLCFGHPRVDAELDAAQAAELRNGFTGMFDLAKRCPTTWLVAVESQIDRTALLLAAIFASVVLGPILSPGGGELFGVRTARAKLEEMGESYRS